MVGRDHLPISDLDVINNDARPKVDVKVAANCLGEQLKTFTIVYLKRLVFTLTARNNKDLVNDFFFQQFFDQLINLRVNVV